MLVETHAVTEGEVDIVPAVDCVTLGDLVTETEVDTLAKGLELSVAELQKEEDAVVNGELDPETVLNCE